MARMNNWKEAEETAQLNAEYFETPFIVFTDTSGNVRQERFSTQQPLGPVTIKYPVKIRADR